MDRLISVDYFWIIANPDRHNSPVSQKLIKTGGGERGQVQLQSAYYFPLW